MPLFARATAAGVGSALAVGLLWGVIPSFGFFGFLIAGGVGYLIGEAMTRAANRRRSRPLLAVACGCVVLAYLLSLVAPLLLSSGLAGIERLPVALGRLLPALLANPFAWIPPIIGAFTATTRFR